MNELDTMRVKWPVERRVVAYQQARLVAAGFAPGDVDGLIGPQTEYALEQWELALGGHPPETWRDALPEGDNYAAMVRAYGVPGSAPTAQFTLPYPMRLAWDLNVEVTRVTLHESVGDSAMGVLREVLAEYGPEGIVLNGFDLYGGGLNVRRKRGGTQWSTHAWGVAMDFDPARNRLRWHADRAHLAKPQCALWWELWEAAGWVSLGRKRDFDWMHVMKAGA